MNPFVANITLDSTMVASNRAIAHSTRKGYHSGDGVGGVQGGVGLKGVSVSTDTRLDTQAADVEIYSSQDGAPIDMWYKKERDTVNIGENKENTDQKYCKCK